jgi:nucleoside-diphosphate-sugar epimerase
MGILGKFMKPYKVLVVGGAGFIGSHVMKLRPDWDVLDLKNGQDVRDGIPGDYDVIVLLAAHLGQTEDDYAHNLEIYTALVKNYAGKIHPYIVYTSSAAVYGDSKIPHLEIEESAPASSYGESKLLGEDILMYTFATAVLRLSNVFGDGDGSGVIDLFKQGGAVVHGDGEQVRDYIYVDKVARAIIKAADDPVHYAGEIYNISSGLGLSVNEVFEKYGEGKPEILPARDVGARCSILSNSLAVQDGLL